MAHRHTDEFRREAVRIALASGLSRNQVASDLGVGFSTLAKWIQKSKLEDMPPAAVELRKLNQRLHSYASFGANLPWVKCGRSVIVWRQVP